LFGEFYSFTSLTHTFATSHGDDQKAGCMRWRNRTALAVWRSNTFAQHAVRSSIAAQGHQQQVASASTPVICKCVILVPRMSVATSDVSGDPNVKFASCTTILDTVFVHSHSSFDRFSSTKFLNLPLPHENACDVFAIF